MKKQVVAYALTGVLALGIVGCGQQQEAATESETQTEEKTEQVEPATKWTDAKDAAAAAKGAGIPTFGAPQSLTVNKQSYKDPTFSYADGVAQATYETGATAIILRKADGTHTAPLSDVDRTELPNKWVKSYEGLDVTLCGSARDAATVITWTDGTADYAVTYQGLGGEEVSMTSNDVTVVVKTVKEANAGLTAVTTETDATGTTATGTTATQTSSTSTTGTDTTGTSTTSGIAGTTTDSSDTTTGSSTSQNSDGLISADDAKTNALASTGSTTTAADVTAELSSIGDSPCYLVSYSSGNSSYNVIVDAQTGEIWGTEEYVDGVLQTYE